MPEVGVGYVPIKPDFDGFGRTLDRGIGPEIDRAGPGISSRFKGIFTSVAALGGGILAGAAIGGFLKGAVEEAQDAAKIGRLTEAVVKSTGGAANVSAGALEKLSGRLSNIAAVDDEVIQGAGNVLLTFTNVRNEIGKGNNIFDRTTEAALNMSQALGMDLQGATLQLGKAMNDPIKGLFALGKAGVSFSEGQKEQIKTMVEAGDTLGAQKIILYEMEKQFGGAAAAAADPMEKLKVVAGNLQEQLGTALLPVITKVADWLGKNLPVAMGYVSDAFGRVKAVIEPFFNTLRTGFTEDEGTAVENFALKIRDLAKWFTESLWPAIQRVVEAVGGWKTVLIVAGIAIAALTAPFTTLVAGVIYAYTQFEGFRNVVDAVASFLTEKVWPAIQTFAGLIVDTFGDLRGWVKTHWDAIGEAIGHVIVAVKAVIDGFIAAIKFAWRAFGDEILTIAKVAWDYISRTVENAIKFVRSIIEAVLHLINGDWGEAWDAIKNAAAAVWDQIKNIIGTALGLIGQVLELALSALRRLWDGAWAAIGAALGAAWDGMLAAVRAYIEFFLDFYRKLPGRILGALGDLAGLLVGVGRSIIDGLTNGVVSAAEGLWGWLKGLPRFIVERLGDLGRVLFKAGKDLIGGLVDGIKDAAGAVGRAIGDAVGGAIDAINPFGDGPGKGAGGTALAKVQRAMQGISGLRVTSTYRTPEANRRAGGSPTSYHLDKRNPAIDVAGPATSLDRLFARLVGIPHRELLWRTTGHFDHLHFAHTGGVVSPAWPTLPGLKADERPAILQVGETVTPRGGGGTVINVYRSADSDAATGRAVALAIRM